MWSIKVAARTGVAGAALSAALAGCAPVGADKPVVALTPTEQYSIQVEEAPDQLALTAHPDGLSLTQRAAIVSLVSRWRNTPQGGDISVQPPAGGAPAAARISAEVMTALHALGVPGDRIRVGDYDGPAAGPVLASFIRLEARGPDCRQGWDNLSSTGSNGPSAHFGCAVTANIAAQIADPRDLLGPAPEGPSDMGRRGVVLGKYRAGETSSTARDDQATGAVSRAVN